MIVSKSIKNFKVYIKDNNEIYENRKVEIERAGSSHRLAEMGR